MIGKFVYLFILSGNIFKKLREDLFVSREIFVFNLVSFL